jgi:ankyrin repeat protein
LRARRPVDRRRLNSLHAAVYDRNALKVSLLLQEPKRDINKLDSYHRFTALHLAIELGYTEFARMLILGRYVERAGSGTDNPTLPGKTANRELRDQDGRTPLHLAVIQGNLELVKLLAAFAVNVNATDALGCTPVHYALLLRQPVLLGRLLVLRPRFGLADASR